MMEKITMGNLKRILVINGPNLNLLGRREPEVYGRVTLDEIEEKMRDKARIMNVEIEFLQSNHEGVIVDKIQESLDRCELIIINPAGYSSSVAIRDALSASDAFKVIEVHISNIFKREIFRQHSLISSVADGIISGCGVQGYLMAMDVLSD